MGSMDQYWSIIVLVLSIECIDAHPPPPSDVTEIGCSFERKNLCGYRWQPDLLPFEIKEEIMTLSAYGVIVLDLDRVNRSKSHGARLFGEYYPARDKEKACLMIRFLTYGPGISDWKIIQRSDHDRQIYRYINNWNAKLSLSNLEQFWQKLTLPIDLTGGPSMFYIEVLTKNGKGLFALDYIRFRYQECSFMQKRMIPCRTNEACMVL